MCTMVSLVTVFVCMYLPVAAHITIQRQQAGTIAIAIAPTTPRRTQNIISRSPTPFPFVPSQPPAAPPTPISFIPSQPNTSSSLTLGSWGWMMTPREVRELLASQPQTGEYYVIIKGRRPGVYLSW